MAFSLAYLKPKKATVFLFIGLFVFYFITYLYLGIFTIPYLTPAAIFIGNAVAPLSPAIMPISVYINLTQWNHRINKFRVVWWCSLMWSVALAVNFTSRYGFALINLYRQRQGAEIEMVCFGRTCTKELEEFGLLLFVILAVGMRWQLDGGMLNKLWDKRAEEMQRKAEEKVAKANGISTGDIEKGDMEKESLLT